jgi:hypothetical protein
VTRFNDWLADRITSSVATMWCAYLFALLALVSLPDAIRGGRPTIVSWIAQTFLQLVLLSIILVGQRLQGERAAAHNEGQKAHNESVHAKLDALTEKVT